MAERVLQQVGQHLAHGVVVGAERLRTGRHLDREPDLPGLGAGGDLGPGLPRGGRHVDFRPRGLPAAGLDPGEVQEIVHQPLHPAGVAEDGAQEHAAHLAIGREGEEGLRVAGDRGERRLELVGDVRHEVPAHRLQAPELGQVVHDEHRPARGERAGVEQHRAAVEVHLAVLDRVPGEHRVHHLAGGLGPEQLRQVGQHVERLVAQQAAGRRVGGHDVAPPVGGDDALHHGLHQGGALRLLPAQLLEAVGELAVHLAEGLDQRVDVRHARAGEPRRGARGDRARRGGDPGQRTGDGAGGDEREHAADQQREQGGAGDGGLSPAHDLVHLPQVRGDPDRTRATGHGDVQHLPTHGLAAAGGGPGASREGGLDLRPVDVALDGGQWSRGKVAVRAHPPGAVHQGDAAVALARRQPPDALAPRGGVGGERLPDQGGLALQRPRDAALQIAAQRALGHQEQHRHREHQHQQGARDQPGGEGHRVRAPRSVPLNR